ncbi:hypothetical protein SAMN04487764_2624 [Gillisia sp. Hel1_33_143]|nr:hypothetical protein SAMN04487764_2624 [Gillisia sp. Hel1_33_143]
MKILEGTLNGEKKSIRKIFLNLRDTKRVNTFNSRCYGF